MNDFCSFVILHLNRNVIYPWFISRLWCPLLQALIQLIEKASSRLPDISSSQESLEEVGYQAAYSRLVYAERKHCDHLLHLAPDLRAHVAVNLQSLMQSAPEASNKLLGGADWDEESKRKLQAYMQGASC